MPPEEDRASHRQHAKKFLWSLAEWILSYARVKTDRQTYKETYSSQYFKYSVTLGPGGEVTRSTLWAVPVVREVTRSTSTSCKRAGAGVERGRKFQQQWRPYRSRGRAANTANGSDWASWVYRRTDSAAWTVRQDPALPVPDQTPLYTHTQYSPVDVQTPTVDKLNWGRRSSGQNTTSCGTLWVNYMHVDHISPLVFSQTQIACQ